MNDSSYTILIPALLLLLAAMVGMLYARFASRSRENSDEIDLVDTDSATSKISEANDEKAELTVDDTQEVALPEPRPEKIPVLEVASVGDKGEEASNRDETEYFDELQEAAAGLAALMRSSPVGKSTPVVYAPEHLEEEAIDALNQAVFDDEPQEILLPVSESAVELHHEVREQLDGAVENGAEAAKTIFQTESEAKTAEVESAEAKTDEVESAEVKEPASGAEEEHELEVIENSLLIEETAEVDSGELENEVISLRSLLGDEVADQFDSLDEGLDDLENLVVSIESALSSLNEGLEEVVSEEEPEAVSEAA